MPIRPWIGLLVLLLICVLPIFSHLDDVPIQLWDEGRLANSAVEMYETGDPLVVTYGNQPEMWSVKPPMLIWLQVLSFKLFGVNDLAFRLPTSLAALFTCFLLYWFFTKKFKAPWIGIISGLVLVTTAGYIRLHGVRTGDYDSLLTFFTTLYFICFYLFIEEDKRKYLLLSILFIICATLTKGIAGLLFLPAMLFYAIYRKKLANTLKTPQLYIGAVGFGVFVIGYYLLREHYNPGYLEAVYNNELGGRYNTIIEGHEGTSSFYFDYLKDSGCRAWFPLYLIGVAVGIFSKNTLIRNFTIFNFVSCLLFTIIISSGSTKLDWYTLPLYPLIAMTVGILIYTACEALYHSEGYFQSKILPYLVILLIGFIPFKDIFRYVTVTKGEGNVNDLSMVLKTALKGKYPYQYPMKIVYTEYQAGLDWYAKMAKHNNKPISHVNQDELMENDLVGVYQDDVKHFIEETYIANVVSTNGAATIYQIHGRK